MNRPNRKSNSHGRRSTPMLMPMIIVGVVLVALYLWTHRADGASVVPSPTSTIDSLLVVKVPEQLNSETQLLKYPGFNVGFNSKHHIPTYVAWDVTPSKADGKLPRSDNFAPDPKVEGCATLADYKGSGFSRGHMAPSADMKWSRESMDACFLLTNMCPQTSALNSGAWKSVEDKTRAWTKRDSTLVIVCGPVLTDRMPRKIGATGVTVPERFFKVILAPYANPPRAIGFIMPNSRVEGGMQHAAVSVDEVERITGLDFFSSLPDEVESTIEAQCNFPLWSARR